jgi:predicted Zn-dependent protease
MDNIDAASVEELTVNGFKAASATAKGEPWSFRLYAIRFGSEVYRFIFAAKEASPESDRMFRDTVNSFRRMTLAEIKSARPLRLRVVPVRPGDTVEKLAGRMAHHDRQVERFRVLNGLDARDKVNPGDLVKIVVE